MGNLQKLGDTTQRPNESIAYTIDVSAVGSSPTVNDVTAYEKGTDGAWTDESVTVLSGSATVSGDVITTPLLESLTDGRTYHVVVNYTISGNDFEDFFQVYCTDER